MTPPVLRAESELEALRLRLAALEASAASREEIGECEFAVSWFEWHEIGQRASLWGSSGFARSMTVFTGLGCAASLMFGHGPFSVGRISATLLLFLLGGPFAGWVIGAGFWNRNERNYEKQLRLAEHKAT